MAWGRRTSSSSSPSDLFFFFFVIEAFQGDESLIRETGPAGAVGAGWLGKKYIPLQDVGCRVVLQTVLTLGLGPAYDTLLADIRGHLGWISS